MPSYRAGTIVDCLTRKLRATELMGDHRVFEVYDDGTLVARIRLSHSFRRTTAIGPGIVAQIKRDLKLPTWREFDDLLRCPLSRDAYLAIVKSRTT